MLERWQALTQVKWPSLDAANFATLLFWLAGLALVGGVIVAALPRLRLEPERPAARDGHAV
jgi:hypothetical protein